MRESTAWGALAARLTTLQARVQREGTLPGSVPARRMDGVRRQYLRGVCVVDALRSAGSPSDAPAPATVQRLVHRLVDGLQDDAGAWLALTAVHHVARQERVLETHAMNVAILSIAVARALALPRDAQADLGLAALVHDIRRNSGSAGPDLDAAAWLLEWGPVEASVYWAAIAATHRDAVATAGVRTAAADVDLGTRIVRIADAYDALTARDGVAGSPDLVLAFMLQGTGMRFDSALLKVFARVVGVYPPGTTVRLRDGSIAVVSRPAQRPEALDRPIVRVAIDADGADVVSPAWIDLSATGEDIVETVDAAALGVDAAALALDR
jgi:hypothetical protein